MSCEFVRNWSNEMRWDEGKEKRKEGGYFVRIYGFNSNFAVIRNIVRTIVYIISIFWCPNNHINTSSHQITRLWILLNYQVDRRGSVTVILCICCLICRFLGTTDRYQIGVKFRNVSVFFRSTRNMVPFGAVATRKPYFWLMVNIYSGVCSATVSTEGLSLKLDELSKWRYSA